MREPMPAVSSSTQPTGALTMNMWLSPSITTAWRVLVSCGVAPGVAVPLAAGLELVAGPAPSESIASSTPSVPATPRAPRRANRVLPWRGCALSEHLRGLGWAAGGTAQGDGRVYPPMDAPPTGVLHDRTLRRDQRAGTASAATDAGPARAMLTAHTSHRVDMRRVLDHRGPRMDAQRVIARRMVIGIPPDGLSPAWEKDFAQFPPAGVILFAARDFKDLADARRVIARLRELARPRRLFVSLDEEGGWVSQLAGHLVVPPNAATLARVADLDTIRWIAGVTARRLHALGFDWDFAPVE